MGVPASANLVRCQLGFFHKKIPSGFSGVLHLVKYRNNNIQ